VAHSKKETPARLHARAARIVAKLRKTYPHARSALNFSNPLELLVATILSAQATDAGVNRITPALFKKYKTAADYASADVQTLQQEIKACGFFRQKTKSIMGAGRMLVEKFGGLVPDTMDELLELPGVARKTANVVLSNAFGKAVGLAVDRHVARVSGRLRLTRNTDPVKIEQDLLAVIPRKHWINFGHALILHGRQVCTARKPKCEICPVNELCPSSFKV
jgi:endonuclease-3